MFAKQMKKIWIKRMFVFLIVLMCVAGLTGILKYQKKEEMHSKAEEKRQELAEAEGTYNLESIVLADTNVEQANSFAEILGAEVRTTKDGGYAVLYLPEGLSVEDVFTNEEYEEIITEMSLDYYAQTEAVDALNRELYSIRPEYNVEDPGYEQQSYLDYLNMRDTWNKTRGGGIKIAVIDTGIDVDHPDFAGRISEMSYNASDDKTVRDYGLKVVDDENGHGTEVAGVLAAPMNDSTGITGIAPEAELIVIKCDCDEYGRFIRSSDLVFALAYAIECDADVINMSFGTLENIYSKYTKLAVDSDIICVAAAGNDGSALPSYPAADENVIGVGSLDTDSWSLATYSNYGFNLVLAPGTVYTTTVEGSYKSVTGTSVSAPQVAGAVALYLSQNQYTEFADVCEVLKASSRDLGIPGEDRQHGFGLLDTYALVCEEKGTITYEMLSDDVENQTQIFVKGHNVQYMPEIELENVILDGWYYDIHCTDEVAYYQDFFAEDTTMYASWINEDEGSAYIYTTLTDGTVEIRSYTGRRRALTVPETLEGKTVTSIGESAFQRNSRLQRVTLPSTLINIGELAFAECTNLRAIEIPEKVTTIGGEAFRECVNLSQISVVKNGELASINDKAFQMSGIRSFHIPNQVNNIGRAVFNGCTGMQSVTVEAGNNHFKIINHALYDINGKTLLYYPTGLGGTYAIADETTTIADYAFSSSRITGVIFPQSVTKIGTYAMAYSMIHSASFTENIEILGDYAFAGCSALNSVVLPDNGKLSMIPSYAFVNCFGLKDIYIPNNVREIKQLAFAGSGLTEIVFSKDSNLVEIGESAFSDIAIKEIEFPKSLETIGEECFSNNVLLNTVKWASGSQCDVIEEGAFFSTPSLKNITFPDSLKSIEERAFLLSGLESVSIGKHIEKVGKGAFAHCSLLKSIDVDKDNEKYVSKDGILYNADETILCAYPGGRSGGYTISDKTVKVEGYAFAGAEKLSSIVFGTGLQEIAEYAFSKCTAMEVPALPASLVTIGSNAFEYCYSFNDYLLIPKSVMSIGRHAFFSDYNLTNIQIEDETEISRLGYGAFAHCGIINFTVPRSVKSMGQEVFAECPKLVTITFEAGSLLENLPAWAFVGASELRQITFEEGSNLKLIEARAMEGLTKLERVTLENCNSLVTIDNYSFMNCKTLSKITFPESLKEIGRYAFNGCEALDRIDAPGNVEFIGRYAFAGTNNMNVYFSAALLPIYLEENWDYGIAGYYVAVSDVISSGDWKYALTNDNKASIVAYTGTASELEIDKIDGYEIISIGGDAFKDNTTLTKIQLPETLQGIYKAAFKGTTALHEIVIPDSVQIIESEAFMNSGVSNVVIGQNSKLASLGQYAFANTKNLESIQIPEQVLEIKDYTFENSGLKNVNFAGNSCLQEIGRYAFAKSGLEKIVIPKNVKKVDHNSFRECENLITVDLTETTDMQIFSYVFYGSGLTEMDIPDSLEYLGDYCLVNCQNLTEINVGENNKYYSSQDGVLMDKGGYKLITSPAGKEGSFTVPAKTEAFGFAAFEGSKLNEIILEDNSKLRVIGYRAFYDCDGIETIKIPDGVMNVGNYSFAYCDNLKTVLLSTESHLEIISKGAFYNCVNITEFYIPNGVKEISEYAFYGCKSMTDLAIAEESQLEGIYEYAFAYSGIQKFTIPEKVLVIGDNAFLSAKIDTLVCNKQVQYIGEYAFADCGLKNTVALEFPETVEEMGFGVLRGATGVEELTLPFLGLHEFDEKLASIYTLYGTEDALYGGVYPEGIKKVKILKGTTLSDYAFYNCINLEQIELSPSTQKIGAGAFSRTNIKEITLPNSIKEIKYGVFGECKSLESIVIPEGVTNLWSNTFGGCISLKSVTLPSTLITIYDGAFNRCSSLISITLPDALEKIGGQAFYGTAIESIFIPKNVTSIGGAAFDKCSQLKTITVDKDNQKYVSLNNVIYTKDYTEMIFVPQDIFGIVELPEGLLKIGDNVFAERDGITEVIFPKTLEEIGNNAFRICTNLKEVKFPEALKIIGENAFSDCKNLSSVTFSEGIESIEGSAFSSTAITEIILPKSLKNLGNGAFGLCHELKNVEILSPDIQYGSSVFYSCDKLSSLILPEGMREIPGSFVCYSDLQEIKLPDSIVTIAEGAFSDTKLQKIQLPESLVTISARAFRDTKLQEIQLPESLMEIGDSAFEGTALETIHIPRNVNSISDLAFANCNKLESITVDENNKFYASENNILYDAKYSKIFFVPKKIEGVLKIKEGVKEIGDGVISGCNELSGIELPDSLEYLGTNFDNCINLCNVKLGNNIQYIGYHSFENTAFQNDEKNWENGVLYAGNYALKFDNSKEWDKVSIREGTTLVAGAFSRDIDSKCIELPDSLKYINAFSFSGYDLLRGIHIPDNVSMIGGSAFWDCPNLRYVDLGNNAELKVGTGAFGGTSYSSGIWEGYFEVVALPYSPDIWAPSFVKKDKTKKLIINTIEEMDNNFLMYIPETTTIYCEAEEYNQWPEGWNQNCKTYYKDEWHKISFYVNGGLISLDAVLKGDVLQIPAQNIIEQYLPKGTVFLGWDMNGDNIVDHLPASPAEHMEIHAVLEKDISLVPTITIVGNTQMRETEVQLLDAVVTSADSTSEYDVIWKSSDEEIAVVDEKGMVTALKEGKVTITALIAENESVSSSIEIEVSPIEYGIKLEQTEGSLEVGDARHLSPEFILPNGDENQTIWTSSNNAIAEVDSGLISALSPGEVYITVEHGPYSARYKLTVTLNGLLDEKTGVVVSKSDGTPMNENTILQVSKKHKGEVEPEIEEAFRKIENEMGQAHELLVYDINLLEGGEDVQLDQMVDIGILLPKYIPGIAVTVYRIEKDGTVTNVNAAYMSRRMQFTTEFLGTYVLGIKSIYLYPIQELKISGASLTLQDNLTINYMVKSALFTEAGFEEPYMTYVLNGKETAVSEYVDAGENYVFSFKNIAPNQMNDMITATLHAKFNGVDYQSASRDYGVITYCSSMLAKSTDAQGEFRTLLVDLLNYGAQSQLYTGYRTDSLANATLTDVQKSWATQTDREWTTVQDIAYKTIDNPSVTWKGAGLMLTDRVEIRLSIAADDITNLSVKAELANGTSWSIPATEFKPDEARPGRYNVDFNGLNSGQMSEPVYFTVYEGDTVVSNTVRYSVESYAYAQANKAEPDTSLLALLKVMMKYGDAAYHYVN